MNYRAEIDGLRALAVVPVILFHAGFEWLSGGFVGVDIFFVISGYLITTILIEDLENNRFSLIKFYVRRARRIFPALFFVMIMCIPFAWNWMIPSQMKEFSHSLIAVSFFASNILFWRESGYFAAAAEEKPLLHTWSLAVEEQYYLLFPIFLFLAWRFGKTKVFLFISLVAAVSLGVSEWGWRSSPIANFYLTPARAWELLAGSMAALILRWRGLQANNPLSTLGLSTIIFAILSFSENTPFPSVYSLVPVFGVVLLILFADKETYVARLLSNKMFVGIGLISYSAYLWHQPLFAFARIRSLGPPSDITMISLGLVTLVLAYGSWRFIEAPFRNNNIVATRTITRLSIFLVLAFLAMGTIGHTLNGIPSRMPPLVSKIDNARQAIFPNCLNDNSNVCRLGDKKIKSRVALIGDSHAGRYAYALDNAFSKGKESFFVYSGNWCAPLLNWVATNNSNNDNCYPWMSETLKEIAHDSEIEVVILAAQWANYTQGKRFESRLTTYSFANNQNTSPGDNPTQFFESLKATLELLIAAGKEVIIIEPVPEYSFSVPNELAKSVLLTGISSSKKLPYANYQKRNNEFFSSLVALNELKFSRINVADNFCNAEYCTPFSNDGLPYYNDSNHLNKLGLGKIVDEVYGVVTGDSNALMRSN